MRADQVHKPFLESTLTGRITARYTRFARHLSSISLFGGFAFDAVTLKRVDTFWENFWVLVHLLLVAGCILLLNRAESPSADPQPTAKPDSWLTSALQFLFGGLLSTFLVFYFRSGSLRVSWPFFLLLAIAFIANERLKRQYARLGFQLSFFFLSLFSFAIFIVPVLVHAIGRLVFLLSGVVSLGLLWLFLRALQFVAGEIFAAGRKALTVSIATIFLGINTLYFLNLIPPLPLSLQDAGVYHAIARTSDGNYLVEAEDQGWLRFFRLAPVFHLIPGGPIYVYSAVFSPTSLNTDIIHEWQTYERGDWVTADHIALRVRGGRGGGYRTYSVKSGLRPGAWRVAVETPTGAILGRVRFNVLPPAAAPPRLKTALKD